tara:strand:+ start:689 stop:988 length:300 start_codon:yes stop_codon:yes gene_type:complete
MPDTRRKEDTQNQIQKQIKYWPVYVFLFGIIAAGFTVQAETQKNTGDISKQSQQMQNIERSIAELKQQNAIMGERSKNTQDDVKDIKQDVKDILKALRK